MLRDVQNQYGSNLPTPFFLDFEKPHGFLAYALLNLYMDKNQISSIFTKIKFSINKSIFDLDKSRYKRRSKIDVSVSV